MKTEQDFRNVVAIAIAIGGFFFIIVMAGLMRAMPKLSVVGETDYERARAEFDRYVLDLRTSQFKDELPNLRKRFLELKKLGESDGKHPPPS